MEMTYKEFIDNILETRGRFNCGEEYHECHHIVPKCMGGTNDEENLIDLFAREHFEAHRLLSLENPENDSLTYAWWMMAHTNNANQRDYEITAEEYEEARKHASETIRKMQTGRRQSDITIKKRINKIKGQTRSEESKQKMRKAQKGKIVSEETKKKLSESCKGRKVSDETKIKISEALKGRACSQKTREKLSKANSGENNAMYGKRGELNPMWGKTLPEEVRKKIREKMIGRKLSEESKQKMSESQKAKWSDEFREEWSIKMSGERNGMYGKHHSEESKEKMRDKKQGKKVIQYDKQNHIIKEWDYIIDAEKELNIDRSSIIRCCKGKVKTAGGFIWRYSNEIEQNELKGDN